MLLNVGDTVKGSEYEVVREFDRQGCMSRMYVVRNGSGVEQLLKVNLSHEEFKKLGINKKNAYKLTKKDHNARTIREFEIVRELQHPNIVQYLDLITIGDNLGILTSSVRNSLTLSEVIENLNNGEVPQEKRLNLLYDIFPQLDEALTYLERIGNDDRGNFLQHRDITPDNILVNDLRKVYLTDFGLAHFLDDKNAERGSDLYCDLFSHRLKWRSPSPNYDRWSLAIVCWEFVLGHHPFVNDKKSQKERDNYLEWICKRESFDEVINKIKNFFTRLPKSSRQYVAEVRNITESDVVRFTRRMIDRALYNLVEQDFSKSEIKAEYMVTKDWQNALYNPKNKDAP